MRMQIFGKNKEDSKQINKKLMEPNQIKKKKIFFPHRKQKLSEIQKKEINQNI